MTESRIIVIQPYFGKLPPTFRIWYASCQANRSIDWLVATDADTTSLPPAPNIRIVKMDFAQMQRRVQACFDFPICLDRPYKLCDFRVFYDRIWQEFVQGYDFWGYCDCDLVFGDIRKFARESILERSEKFLGHGHFSLLRSEAPHLRQVIESCKAKGRYDYKHVLSTPSMYALEEFDHYGVSYQYQKDHPDLFHSGYHQKWRIFDDLDPQVDHFTDPVKDARFDARGVLYQYENGRLERVFMENGEIKKEETLYAHFMKRRMKDLSDSTSSCTIVPDSIIPARPIDEAFLKLHGKRFIDHRKLKATLTHLRANLRLGSRFARRPQPK